MCNCYQRIERLHSVPYTYFDCLCCAVYVMWGNLHLHYTKVQIIRVEKEVRVSAHFSTEHTQRNMNN